jgi:hypothetical protein
MNKFPVWLAFAALLMLSGCQMLQEREQMTKFDETVRHYAAALRWAQEVSAARHIRSRETGAGNPAVVFDKNIQVTSYELKSIDFSADKKEALVTASMSYYAVDSAAIKVIRDQQLWWYDDDDGQWYMDGEIPSILLAKP